MTQDQEQKIRELIAHPNWKAYLEVAEEIIQREDRISSLPKFKTATALQKHLEAKQKAFEMFHELITIVDYEPMNPYENEIQTVYKTIQEKRP